MRKLILMIAHQRLLIFVVVSCYILHSVIAACPSGWTENLNICYKFNIQTGTGEACQTACNGLSASMLCITSDSVNNFVKNNVLGGTGMYVGYYRVPPGPQTFAWVSGCSSSFTNWNSGMNQPGSGAWVAMGPAGFWGTSDIVVTYHCSCQFTQSVAPTSAPISTPTAKPTTLAPIPNPTLAPIAKPTCHPTRNPTMVPTLGVTDCRVSCSFLTDGSVLSIASGNLFAKIQLPTNFRIQFDVYVSGIATYPDVRNILDIVEDGGSGSSLFRIGLPDSNNLRLAYNNVNINNFGPALPTGYTSTFSTVIAGYAYGVLLTTTYYTHTPTVAFEVDTTGKTYNLYLSNNDGMPSSGGAIRNIYITEPPIPPSALPTILPTIHPTNVPTRNPTSAPTRTPTAAPTAIPSTALPTASPSRTPSLPPTTKPSVHPTASPTVAPSATPTMTPTTAPTAVPTVPPTASPSTKPTPGPTLTPTTNPTLMPTVSPTPSPSTKPTAGPTLTPTTNPTLLPTVSPTVSPSAVPSSQPSAAPSVQPSAVPTSQPSTTPTSQPSDAPSMQPSAVPSAQPSCAPSTQPSGLPTMQPSAMPSSQPSGVPSTQPSGVPTAQPSAMPSTQPSGAPSTQPNSVPTMQPSAAPSTQPSSMPTTQPSSMPSSQPSDTPSTQPSGVPSAQPSAMPSTQPSSAPSTQPSSMPTAQPSAMPSTQPSGAPSTQPSGVPTMQPSAAPSTQPSGAPSMQPSGVPTVQPRAMPSSQPSGTPSTQPSGMPTEQPSTMPSSQPSGAPSTQPSGVPTAQPSAVPSIQPSAAPSTQPSAAPSMQPSAMPSTQPSGAPSTQPSAMPSSQPSGAPSTQPSGMPTAQPSAVPSSQPSGEPSTQPSGVPTAQPSAGPSAQPSGAPSTQPSGIPTAQPSAMPSIQPSAAPSTQPSAVPTMQPSAMPSSQPSVGPSAQPSSIPTAQPSAMPSTQPSRVPSTQPSVMPTVQPSAEPSTQPSGAPSTQPTRAPTAQPSAVPSNQPSGAPSTQPSDVPTVQPSTMPSTQPSAAPSAQPSGVPSTQPSAEPSTQPSAAPSAQPSSVPTAQPSAMPSAVPSTQPSTAPSTQPSGVPTVQPSAMPSSQPSGEPSTQPSGVPTAQPSARPSTQPSTAPSTQPSGVPTVQPSAVPSIQPSAAPSAQPSSMPTAQPSAVPSSQPSDTPSMQPSGVPTVQPSAAPSSEPSSQPSGAPSTQPSAGPTVQPSGKPSSQPSSTPSTQPSGVPTVQPSTEPSAEPSSQPSSAPSTQPSGVPTVLPSAMPTIMPTADPTTAPSVHPTTVPTAASSAMPSAVPSAVPSPAPTVTPTIAPTATPTVTPTIVPTAAPTVTPTTAPTASPSTSPSTAPAPTASISSPSASPATVPTSAKPTARPSASPSAVVLAPEVLSLTALAAADVVSGSTTIAVTVTLAEGVAAGSTVHCGAFPIGVQPNSLSQIRMQQFSTPASSERDGISTISITGLIAASTYDVYCATQIIEGVSLTLDKVLYQHATATTACCRSVTVALSVTSVATESVNVNAVLVTLDALPDEQLTLTIAAVSDPLVFSPPQFYPDTVTIASSAASRSARFTLIAGATAGTFTITVTATGADAQKYQVAYSSAVNLRVTGIGGSSTAPALTDATFTADGSAVLVTFDTATNRFGGAGVFTCSNVLTFVGSDRALCQWTSSTALSVYPSTSVDQPSISVNSVISVPVGSQLRAACPVGASLAVCAAWPTAAATTVSVRAPAFPAAPTVALQMPASLHGCASLSVDLSASTGAGGRPWTLPAFTVSEAANDASAAVIESILNRNATVGSPIIVPNKILANGATYTVTTTLCNFLSSCGVAARTVVVDKNAALPPVAGIAGLSQRTISRDSPLSLFSTSYVGACDGSKTMTNLARSWVVYENSVENATLVSRSADPAVFRLPAFQLTTGHYYDVVHFALNTRTGLAATSKLSVFVKQGAVVAQVAGGSAQSIPLGSIIRLDASISYDSDLPFTASAAQGLTFDWTCVQISPVFSLTCPLTFVPATTTSVLSLAAGSTSVNTTAKVTVTVSDIGGSRSSTADVLVRALSPASAVAAIITTAQRMVDVNTNNAVVVAGQLTTGAGSPCTARWEVDSAAVNLQTAALSPITAPIPQASSRVLNLVLAANSLPVRSALSFTLTCGQTFARVAVITNGPPLPGQLSVQPPSGTELSTEFLLSTAAWTDPHLPLSYQFGVVSASSGLTLVLQAKSSKTFGTAALPAGVSENGFRVTVSVRVYDALNAHSTATAPVVVNARTNTSSALLQSLVTSQLTASAGSNDAVKATISLSSEALNAVSCSAAPNCASLFNRAACSRVQNTCGPCLAGFIGDAGVHNNLCVNASRLSTPSADICDTNADCGAWSTCQTVDVSSDKQCVVSKKPCLNSCSNNGRCVAVNVNSRAQLTSDCKQGDPTCQSICICNAGYGGASCAEDIATLQQKQEVRSALLQSLAELTTTDEVNDATVAVWGGSLAALSQVSDELSPASAATVNSLAQKIIASTAGLGGASMSEEVSDNLLESINAAADAGLRSSGADSVVLALQTLQTISLFNDLLASQLVAGQISPSYVYDNFRLTALRRQVSTGGNFTLSVPQSGMETGSDTSRVSIYGGDGGGGGDDQEEFSVSVVSTAASTYGTAGAAFNANPVQVSVARSSDTSSVVHVRLVNNAPVQYTNASSAEMTFNTTCSAESNDAVYEHLCPVTGAVLIHNCTGLSAGVLMSRCPEVLPACAILDTTTGELDTNSTTCAVSSYTSLVTECACTIPGSSSVGSSGGDATSRRLSGTLARSGLLDVVSSSVYLGNEFVNTFNSADDMTSLDDLKQVLIVIIMFGTLWAGGIMLIFGCAFRRRVLQKFHQAGEDQLQRKVQSAALSRSPAAVRQNLVDYVVEIFPAVFSNKPFFSRLYGEIARHHKYLMVFTAPQGDSGDKQRVLTGIQLLTVQTMLMFLLALLYDVQGPSDDGTCPTKDTYETCLYRKSPFDHSQTYCEWTRLSGQSEHSCIYQQPHFTLQVVIYIAVMVALLVAIFSYPIDRIFDLLSAPVADDIKVSAQDSALKRVGRRLSNAARRASNAALSVASAARTKLASARASIVGAAARKIPDATAAAHALAAASISVVADNSRKLLQERQLSRMRVYYESGGGAFRNTRQPRAGSSNSSSNSDSSDSSSDGDSSSDSGSGSGDDSGTTSKVARVRNAERVGALGNVSGGQDSEGAAVTTKAERGGAVSDVEATLRALSEEVSCQRRLLKASETESYDAQWGIDPTGEFALGESSRIPCLPGKQGARELIIKELIFVRTETAARVEKLNIATDSHIGLEILHLFIKDLLGRNTPAARIFETKSEEDFQHTKVVTRTSKRIAVVALLLINFFFVYYAMLTGFRRGLSWQRMYLIASIVQFVVEILLFETMECVWINCCIPLLVSDEVRIVGDSIIEVVQQLCSSTSYADATLFLNAPDYLFVSTNVAKKFPHLMESILVQTYTTHLPGELAKTWQVGSIARLRRRDEWRNLTLFASLMAALQVLGTAPFIFHRMFIRFLQPFVFSGLVLLWQVVISDIIYISAACACLAAVAAYLVYSVYIKKTRTASPALVVPQIHIGEEGNEVHLVRNRDRNRTTGNASPREGSLHLPPLGLRGASGGNRAGASASPRSRRSGNTGSDSSAAPRLTLLFEAKSGDEDDDGDAQDSANVSSISMPHLVTPPRHPHHRRTPSLPSDSSRSERLTADTGGTATVPADEQARIRGDSWSDVSAASSADAEAATAALRRREVQLRVSRAGKSYVYASSSSGDSDTESSVSIDSDMEVGQASVSVPVPMLGSLPVPTEQGKGLASLQHSSSKSASSVSVASSSSSSSGFSNNNADGTANDTDHPA